MLRKDASCGAPLLPFVWSSDQHNRPWGHRGKGRTLKTFGEVDWEIAQIPFLNAHAASRGEDGRGQELATAHFGENGIVLDNVKGRGVDPEVGSVLEWRVASGEGRVV